MPRPGLLAAALVLLASGCGDVARLTVEEGSGPTPALPPPAETRVPTVYIAPAQGWAEGRAPTPAPGLEVTAFAVGFDHPRWLHVLPNGDVLVAEARSPKVDASGGGIRAAVTERMFEIAGAGGPSADRITLARDADGDGVADLATTLVDGLQSPLGMAFLDDSLFVANSGSLVRFPYALGQTRLDATPDTVAVLPLGGYNQHWTRNVIASDDGRTLYVAVGSASNIAEHGLDAEVGRAAIWTIDRATGTARTFASGLRNPVGMAWKGDSGELWTAVNERDELGSDLVPDYMTSVCDGCFYGWPWTYWGVEDPRVTAPRPADLPPPLAPDYALGPHTASLGLAWVEAGVLFPEAGMVVGQHGSWNRKPRSGYKVVFVPFEDGAPSGLPRDVLTGFLSDDGVHAYGRPVGVAVAADGALLVADDVGNVVWRVARR